MPSEDHCLSLDGETAHVLSTVSLRVPTLRHVSDRFGVRHCSPNTTNLWLPGRLSMSHAEDCRKPATTPLTRRHIVQALGAGAGALALGAASARAQAPAGPAAPPSTVTT